MADDDAKRVTKIVNAWADGDEELAGEVFDILEGELRQIARTALFRDDRLSREVEPADLISELYLKLRGDFARNDRHFESTEKFKAMARRAMRNLLIDLARKGGTPRRSMFTVVERLDRAEPVRHQFYAPDFYHALDRLAAKSPDLALAFECRHIEGRSLDEVAATLKQSLATAKRRLAAADQWMRIQLQRTGLDPA
jgi:RNA polymerase sigma factor (TIGR02999 family)